jgi:8-oxo-dGTP diphosphatase
MADKKTQVSVVILIREHNDNIEVLLERRGSEPKKHEWAFPGGKIEQNETEEEAAIREIKEETNLDIKNVILVDILKSENKTVNMFCTIYNGPDNTQAGDDAEYVEWVNIKDIPKLAWDDEKYLKKAIRKLFKNKEE